MEKKRNPGNKTSRRDFLKTGGKVLPALAVMGVVMTTSQARADCFGSCRAECADSCVESCKGDCMGSCNKQQQ